MVKSLFLKERKAGKATGQGLRVKRRWDQTNTVSECGGGGGGGRAPPTASPVPSREENEVTKPKSHVPSVKSTHGTLIVFMLMTCQNMGIDRIKETLP